MTRRLDPLSHEELAALAAAPEAVLHEGPPSPTADADMTVRKSSPGVLDLPALSVDGAAAAPGSGRDELESRARSGR